MEPVTLTYHVSCHLAHGECITAAPRELLRLLPGVRLVDLTESTWCCGSAGDYSITRPEESEALLTRKTGHILATGTEILATAASPVRVLQPVTLPAMAYRNEPMMMIAGRPNEG